MTIFLYFFLFTFLSAIPAESDHQQNARHVVANNNFEETTISSSKKDNFDRLQRKSHPAKESNNLKIEHHLLKSSTGNVKRTNRALKTDYRSRRKVENSPLDINPLNFRNAPRNVASKNDWNRISQLLEDGRGTRPTYPTAHPYLRNGQNDRILVRPIPRYGRFQNEGELERHISVDEGMMNNIRENNDAHNQFKYDRKRKVPDNHLFESTPNNFRQTPINSMTNEHEEYITRVLENFASNEDWDHYLQLSEANHETDSTAFPYWRNAKQDQNRVSQLLENGRETDHTVHPSLRNGQNDRMLVGPVSGFGRFKNEGELEKHISPHAHSQFEYDKKRKAPSGHIFGVSPDNFKQTTMSLQSLPNTKELANVVSEESSSSISKEVYKDLALSGAKKIFAKLPRFKR